MPYRKSNIWASIDWTIITIYLILVIMGWFSIYASSYDFDQVSIFDLSGRAGTQMVWILTSLVLGFSILMIESNWYDIFAYWIYFFVILLLIATIFLAPDIKGSRSWLVLGPVRIQSAEFAKFATALAIACTMNTYKFELMKIKNFIKILALIFFPLVLILLQKETGSALVFIAFFLVLYREGMPGYILFVGFCAILFFVIGIKYDDILWNQTPAGEFVVFLLIIISANFMLNSYKKGRHYAKYTTMISVALMTISFIISFFIEINFCWIALGIIALTILFLLFNFIKYRASTYLFIAIFALASTAYSFSINYMFDEVLEPHQKIRIEVALGMTDDPSGAGYNVNQSKIAIGSGGVLGKGYLNGTQTKLKYVPEQDTDFIFCTVGEEKGFLGTTITLFLFVFLIIRLILLAERQRSTFNRVYGYSVASVLFFHIAINIGMVIGITPVIGIPLPFFSYGGSSLWSFTALLFIFLRLDASKNDHL